MLSIDQIAAKVDRLKSANAGRDTAMGVVHEARRNNYAIIAPEMLPEGIPAPLVANSIDIFARDIAEKIAPLPSINCSSASMVSDTAKRFADKRTKIANHYIWHSKLRTSMLSAADWYVTFSFVPFIVEADFDARMPRIRPLFPMGRYPEYDRWGRCISLTERMLHTVGDLCAQYPEYANRIKGQLDDAATQLEVIKYTDDHQVVLYVPSKKNLVLNQARNPLGKCPVVVARRPGFERGQFDDIVWVQVARSVMAALALEAAKKSVEAPIVLPEDATELALGSDAVIRTRSPEGVKRLPLDVPSAAFMEGQLLSQEVQTGARASATSGGQISASVITGRGVQELNSSYDTQISTAQEVFADVFRDLFCLAFEMDEKLWPNTTKQIQGSLAGAPYDITYRPARDIDGDYKVDVSYGFAAGMDPNRALVFMLQLRGDRDISRELLMRQLPMDVNVTEEMQRVDIEEMRDAAKQGVAALVQSIPAMAAQGGDPSQIVAKVASIIQGRQKGKSIEDLIVAAFPPPPPPDESAEGEPPTGGPDDQGGGDQLPPGMQPSGLMQGVAPGQAGMAPGGRPSVQQLMAGLASSGRANLQASVARRVPA